MLSMRQNESIFIRNCNRKNNGALELTPFKNSYYKKYEKSKYDSSTNDSSPLLTPEELNYMSQRLNYRFTEVLLESSDISTTNSLLDELNYSVAWFHYHKKREELFSSWYLTFGNSSWERWRLRSIALYWRTCITHRISPTTIHLTVWISNRLFSARRQILFTKDWFAGVVVSSLRLALKFEERPESLWCVGKIWDIFPIFDDWAVDKSDKFLFQIEAESLETLNDSINVPLAIQFFDRYIRIGGWPTSTVKKYSSLGHYILALSSFASGDKSHLINVPSSVLGAAAAVLAIKIVNGNKRVISYEYFPERLAAYSELTMKQLHPIIRGLAALLRKKPFDSHLLAQIYPEWGGHDWR